MDLKSTAALTDERGNVVVFRFGITDQERDALNVHELTAPPEMRLQARLQRTLGGLAVIVNRESDYVTVEVPIPMTNDRVRQTQELATQVLALVLDITPGHDDSAGHNAA